MIDLFEQYETLSPDLKKIIMDFDTDKDLNMQCCLMLNKMIKKGYTFEYDVDGIPYYLRKLN